MVVKRLVVAIAAPALAGSLPLPDATAAPPCWKRLINDWFDGRIDSRYSCACDRTATRKLPPDRPEIGQEIRRRANACRR